MRTVTLRGSGSVAAGTVYALGRNYAEHAQEMNAPAEPVVFLKPASALLPGGGTVPWPAGSALVHHEVELVLLLGDAGAIAGVAIGVDLTARDLQDEAKKKSQPWARSKGFPGSAPLSEFVPAAAVRDWGALDLALWVDGAERQRDRASSMLLPPPAIVATLARWFDLDAGDVVFTGTPKGVGPVEPGALVRAACAALGISVEFRLAARG
jgi:fumarylpyruvate hydrolase